MSIYDSIVVGAGPAGSSSAYTMASSGLDVLVLEKEKMPRSKCCAGGIPRKVAGVLDFDLSSCCEIEAEGAVFSWLSRQRRYLEIGEILGWVVRREISDYFLLQQARKAGARIEEGQEFIGLEEEGNKVVVHTHRGSFFARTLVGADGAGSRVARQLGLGNFRNFGFALETRLNVPERVLKDRGNFLYFDMGGVPQGYAWIFPRRDHLSAGVATRRCSPLHLKSYLRDYLEREGLGKEYRRAQVRGSALSFGFFPTVLVKGRCLLAGAAAGLTDRLTGEGIYQALRSGQLAARAVKDFLSGEGDLKNYQTLIRHALGENLFWANILSRIMGAFPQLIFDRVLSDRKRARKGMLVTLGKLNYRQLLFKKME